MERGLLRDLLTKKDERTPLQKRLNSYDMYIWDEKQHKEKLRVALEELITCKNEDEMELLIEEKIEGLEEEINLVRVNRERSWRKLRVTFGTDTEKKRITYPRRICYFHKRDVTEHPRDKVRMADHELSPDFTLPPSLETLV